MGFEALARGRKAGAVDAEPVEGPWDLPEGWRWERLGAVSTEPMRGAPASRFNETFRYLDVSSIDGAQIKPKCLKSKEAPSRARQFVEAGDTVLSGVRVYLRNIAMVQDDQVDVASTAFCVLRPGSDLDARFMHRWISSDWFINALIPLQRGNSPPAVLDADVRNQPIPVPPLDVQRAISARVATLFAEIGEGEAALAEARAGVETYRKALLKAAVTGELTADWRIANPPQETGEQLLARILADRRANGHVVKKSQAGELVAEDDLPMLPDSWIWCRNEQAGVIQLGRQRTPKDHDGPHMRPYLRVANVYEERIDLRDVKQMNFTPAEFETFELKPGDILLNEGQSLELVGRPAMFRGEAEGCCFQNTLVRFRAGPDVDGEYALLTFLYAMHTKRFQRIAKITTNIAHLGAGRFAEIGFPLAPLAEQREVVRLYRAHMKRFAEAISTLSETSALRQSILAAAFRGELAA